MTYEELITCLKSALGQPESTAEVLIRAVLEKALRDGIERDGRAYTLDLDGAPSVPPNGSQAPRGVGSKIEAPRNSTVASRAGGAGGGASFGQRRPWPEPRTELEAEIENLRRAGEITPDFYRESAKERWDPKLPCLLLVDLLGVEDPKRVRLLGSIAKEAREASEGPRGEEGRGIPLTESPHTYHFFRRGGPARRKRRFRINGTVYEIAPPLESRPDEGTYELWGEFEKILNDIKDVRLPPAEETKRQNLIAATKVTQWRRGFHWIEKTITDTKSGIPTISAETARQILIASGVFPPSIDLGLAPRSFIDPSTHGLSEEFSALMREIVLERVFLSRRERYAMARILMTPLGLVEKTMFDAAFPPSAEEELKVPQKKGRK